jgi:hypothetical protein
MLGLHTRFSPFTNLFHLMLVTSPERTPVTA